MQSPLKLVGWALAGTLIGLVPALAQPKTDGKAQNKAPSRPAATKAAAVEAREAAPKPGVQPSPVPKVQPEEAAHKARYDAAIADTRDRALSAEDASRIREAVDAIAAGNLSKAKALRDQVRDPTGAKLIDWYRYRS